jgi:HEAT repeat protein
VPRLVRIARDPGRDDITRRLAIEELSRHGTPETVGEFFREALGYEEDQHRWAAADGLAAVGSRIALAELRARAEDEREKQHVRQQALRAFVVLADPADARVLLRRLSASGNSSVRGRAAEWLRAVE